MRRVVSLYLPTFATDRIRRRAGRPPDGEAAPLVTWPEMVCLWETAITAGLAGGTVHYRERETVMIVEDDPSVRMFVTEVLREIGYRTIEATDDQTAIPLLQAKGAIDLLVTDVGLPGLNGRQLAEIARESRPGRRVLFITGYAQNATIRSGFIDEGMEMLTKLFSVEALAIKIRDMVGN